MICTLTKKLDKPIEKTPEGEKGNMDKLFAKRQLGRPISNYDRKRAQSLKMVNEKVKQPKQQTLHSATTSLPTIQTMNMFCRIIDFMKVI